jgi:hypothetical protein
MSRLFLAFAVLVAAVLLAGCATSKGIYKNMNGEELTISSARFMWQTEEISLSMQTNGLPTFGIKKSQTDTQAVLGTMDTLIKAGALVAPVPK